MPHAHADDLELDALLSHDAYAHAGHAGLAGAHDMAPVRRPERKRPAIISTALNARISSMTGQSCAARAVHKSRTYTLPLVDAAVQAVTRAARAYSDTLACVVSPVAASAAGAMGMSRPAVGSTRVAKKRKTRRRRTLLSFDDREVKPLLDDDVTPESPLTRYLNCPSPCSKRVKAC